MLKVKIYFDNNDFGNFKFNQLNNIKVNKLKIFNYMEMKRG